MSEDVGMGFVGEGGVLRATQGGSGLDRVALLLGCLVSEWGGGGDGVAVAVGSDGYDVPGPFAALQGIQGRWAEVASPGVTFGVR